MPFIAAPAATHHALAEHLRRRGFASFGLPNDVMTIADLAGRPREAAHRELAAAVEQWSRVSPDARAVLVGG